MAADDLAGTHAMMPKDATLAVELHRREVRLVLSFEDDYDAIEYHDSFLARARSSAEGDGELKLSFDLGVRRNAG